MAGESFKEFRVVAADGKPVGHAYGGLPTNHRAFAVSLIAANERNGKHGPYRLQSRRVTISRWRDDACTTGDCDNAATRFVEVEDTGEHPYCDDCARSLPRDTPTPEDSHE